MTVYRIHTEEILDILNEGEFINNKVREDKSFFLLLAIEPLRTKSPPSVQIILNVLITMY